MISSSEQMQYAAMTPIDVEPTLSRIASLKEMDMVLEPVLSGGAIEQKSSVVHRNFPQPTLTDMPTEMIIKIFNSANLCNSTCLALTCKRLYAIHRRLHPRPIPLDVQFDYLPRPHPQFHLWGTKDEKKTLATILYKSGWFDSRYRLSRHISPLLNLQTRFLAVAVYGADDKVDSHTFPKVAALYFRYTDYRNCNGGTEDWNDHGPEERFPCPNNMGGEWDKAACQVIVNSFFRIESRPLWRQYWVGCWIWETFRDDIEIKIWEQLWDKALEGVKGVFGEDE